MNRVISRNPWMGRSIGLFATVLLLAMTAPAHAVFTTFSSSGADAASIQTTVDSFRATLGALNPNVAGSFGTGRREINWDGVPSTFADPNALPGNFFNVNSPRGVVLSTPGTGFLVSASSGGSTPALFGFGNDFTTFSPQRLFTAVNSNITDVTFFVPGSTTNGRTNGFGVVFTDVEVANTTQIQLFGAGNVLLTSQFASVSGNQGLTFLGVIDTEGQTIERVRITSGLNTIVSNGVLGNPNDDVVVMDDFIYGEVVAVTVPEASPALLVGLALPMVGAATCRRRRSV